MPNDKTDSPVANIRVKSIYSLKERERIRVLLTEHRKKLGVGMTLFHADITYIVAANNARIQKPNSQLGLNVDMLSVKNLTGFFQGIRSNDTRVQILDAYLQISQEGQNTS